ncbi:hypothetical protein [Erwinia amylovora]
MAAREQHAIFTNHRIKAVVHLCLLYTSRCVQETAIIPLIASLALALSLIHI